MQWYWSRSKNTDQLCESDTNPELDSSDSATDIVLADTYLFPSSSSGSECIEFRLPQKQE